MKISLTRTQLISASSVLLVVLAAVGFLALRRVPRVRMDRYAPANALAFVEVDSLADLADGFTHTKAWRELAPVLGLSSQLRQLGMVGDLIGRTGLGPDEAILAGRAQYAIAITGVESKTLEAGDRADIHLKPLFALIIETHMKPETAARLVNERTSAVVERIYGEPVGRDTETYYDTTVLVFRGPPSKRPVVAAALGSVVVLANDFEALTSCLDSISGRASSLGEDTVLKQMRSEAGIDPSVFGYVTASGIEKLVELWPLLALSRATDPDIASLVADLIEHVSKQTVSGALYSLTFEGDGVTEKYLTVLRPQVAEALVEPMKPAPEARFEAARLVPYLISGATFLSAERVGELPERLLKRLSPNLDIVAGVAFREFVIDFRKQYGLEPSDSIGDATGSEAAILDFGDDQPRVLLIKVTDKKKLEPVVTRYILRKGGSVRKDQVGDFEIAISASDDRRAASFVGDFLILGTRDQISRLIETSVNRDGLDGDARFKEIRAKRPANASLVSYRSRVDEAGKLVLAFSKLTRVTDGSAELLDSDSAREALNRLPRSNSFTEFREFGIYLESHSAVGSFSYLTSLIAPDTESP